MSELKVNEIFYSLQGEGARAGEPSIFIRLSGCDLTCGFCDTEFTSGKEMAVVEIIEYCQKKFPKCFWIIWTGGEPALQLTKEIVQSFKQAGYSQAIETNGNHPVPDNLDFITLSPKVAEHILGKNFPKEVSEMRYVRHSGQMNVPETKIKAQHYFLSPMFDGDKVNKENLRHCISLCLKNPKWKLSIQLHKLLKIL